MIPLHNKRLTSSTTESLAAAVPGGRVRSSRYPSSLRQIPAVIVSAPVKDVVAVDAELKAVTLKIHCICEQYHFSISLCVAAAVQIIEMHIGVRLPVCSAVPFAVIHCCPTEVFGNVPLRHSNIAARVIGN